MRPTLFTAAALQRSRASRKLSRRTRATDMAGGSAGGAASAGEVQPWRSQQHLTTASTQIGVARREEGRDWSPLME